MSRRHRTAAAGRMVSADLIRVNKRELVIAVDDGAGRGEGDVIRVENVADEDIAFKMKTTNPNRYIVRPNVSCIPKGKSADIKVFLAETAPQPAPGPSKDRFQLRVALAPGLSEELSATEFWREHEDDQSLLRLKFSVKFVPFVPPAEPRDESEDPPSELPDAESLLEPGRAEDAVKKVEALEEQLHDRDSELARIRTALKETIEEKDRTLRASDTHTPVAANKAVWDAYGGLGVAALCMLVVVAVLAIIFNGRTKPTITP